MPRMPRAPRAPRVRDPRTAARSKVSQNPLVRGFRRIRSNRFVRKLTPKGAGAGRTGDGPSVAMSTAVTPTSGALGTTSPSDATVTAGTLEASFPGGLAAPSPPSLAPRTQVAPDAPHHHPGPDASRSERRRARRAARRAAPKARRTSRRERRRIQGVLWSSVLEVGRAQWPDTFDTRGLDHRFVTYFDLRQRLVVTVPDEASARPTVDPGGVVVPDPDPRRTLVGELRIAGFDPDGARFVGADPFEGRMAERPVFELVTTTLPDPVPVTPEMRIEGVEEPNGRFRMLAGSRLGVG